jgi:hypothetical protein
MSSRCDRTEGNALQLSKVQRGTYVTMAYYTEINEEK